MEQVGEYLKRLQLSSSVGSQAQEYYRLCEVKCPRAFSPSCLAAICIELSCSKLRVPLNKKEALKLAGVKPKVYTQSFQTIEKLLNISSTIGLQEMAVQFDCLQAVGVARQLLERYKKSLSKKFSEVQQKGMDLDKPLFPAAALYCSCKLLKTRCDQTKFVAVARCKKNSFQEVVEEMNKCIPDNIDEFKENKRKRKRNEDDAEEGGVEGVDELPKEKPKREHLHDRILSDPTREEYRRWKERVLQQAKAELAAS